MTIPRKQIKAQLTTLLSSINYGTALSPRYVSVRAFYASGVLDPIDSEGVGATTNELSYPYIYITSEETRPNSEESSMREFGGSGIITYKRGYQFRINVVFDALDDDMIDMYEEILLTTLQQPSTRNLGIWEDIYVESISSPITAGEVEILQNTVIKSFVVMCTYNTELQN